MTGHKNPSNQTTGITITGGGPPGTWELIHNDEFDEDLGGGHGLGPSWSPYYLRSWNIENRVAKPTQLDSYEGAESKSFVKDGLLFLTSNRDMWKLNWNGYDRVSGIGSYEGPYVHKASAPVNAREIPRFEGFASKYGYYELRIKLPNTRDGAHFAWWMVGTQTDQHPSIQTATSTGPGSWYFKKPNTASGGGDDYNWGWTNQGAEYDLFEGSIDAQRDTAKYAGLSSTVHHTNGSNELNYYHAGWGNPLVQYVNRGVDPYNEFHTIGMEWTEAGCDYYFDGSKVSSGSYRYPSANYKMLQIFSLYNGQTTTWSRSSGAAGYGNDRGVFPKDVLIDYFRVWQKTEEHGKPSIIQIYDAPYYFKKPASGSSTFQMKCRLLDQFEKEITDEATLAKIKWAFSASISGSVGNPNSGYGKNTFTQSQGNISIDASTGLVTIQSSANDKLDYFVIAYLDDNSINWRRGVRELRHIKLSSGLTKLRLGQFIGNDTNKNWGHINCGTVRRGETVDVTAKVYDQYLAEKSTALRYSIAKDISARAETSIAGVSLSEVDGKQMLTVAGDVPIGYAIIVNAKTTVNVPFEGFNVMPGNISPVNGGTVDKVQGNLVLTVVQ